MNEDKSGESGAFLFSRRVPDFCDGRRSFPTNENPNLYRRGRRRPSAVDFAHYQSPKLLGSSPPSQINMASLENLGQTSGDFPIYRQNLRWSAKSTISDRLGFSRHMKTRLKQVRFLCSVFVLLFPVSRSPPGTPGTIAHQVPTRPSSNQRLEQCLHAGNSHVWSTLVAFAWLVRKLTLIECPITIRT